MFSIYKPVEEKRYLDNFNTQETIFLFMKPGIAFVRGMGIFGKRNYSKQRILSCLRKIENMKYGKTY